MPPPHTTTSVVSGQRRSVSNAVVPRVVVRNSGGPHALSLEGGLYNGLVYGGDNDAGVVLYVCVLLHVCIPLISECVCVCVCTRLI